MARTTSVVIMWEMVPPAQRLGVIRSYTISGYIQQFRTDTAIARRRRSLSQMVNISAGLRECLMSSNRNESFSVTVNSSQLSVMISNLGMCSHTSSSIACYYHGVFFSSTICSLQFHCGSINWCWSWRPL